MGLSRDDLDRIERILASASTPLSALAMLLIGTRHLTRAQAGIIFVRRGDELQCTIAQNDVFVGRLGDEELQRRMAAPSLTLEGPSIAGYVARTGTPVNVPDVYGIPRAQPYEFDPRWDLELGYRTCSLLALPLREPSGQVFGVLQLINALDDEGEVVPFDQAREESAGELVTRLARSMLAAGGR